jgi:hypothetical protein
LTPPQSPHTSRAFLTTRRLSTGVSTLGHRLFHTKAGSPTARKRHRDAEEAGNRTVSARPNTSSKGKGRREGICLFIMIHTLTSLELCRVTVTCLILTLRVFSDEFAGLFDHFRVCTYLSGFRDVIRSFRKRFAVSFKYCVPVCCHKTQFLLRKQVMRLPTTIACRELYCCPI